MVSRVGPKGVANPSPSPAPHDKEEGDSGIDANSQGSCSSSDVKAQDKTKNKKKKKAISPVTTSPVAPIIKQPEVIKPKLGLIKVEKPVALTSAQVESVKMNKQEKENVAPVMYAPVDDINKRAKQADKLVKLAAELALTENKSEKREK